MKAISITAVCNCNVSQRRCRKFSKIVYLISRDLLTLLKLISYQWANPFTLFTWNRLTLNSLLKNRNILRSTFLKNLRHLPRNTNLYSSSNWCKTMTNLKYIPEIIQTFKIKFCLETLPQRCKPPPTFCFEKFEKFGENSYTTLLINNHFHECFIIPSVITHN